MTDDLDDIRSWFANFPGEQGKSAWPLYGFLAERIAADDDVLRHAAMAQPAQRLSVLLFAAVHAEVLAGRAPELDRWYPTVGGQFNGDESVWEAFRAVVVSGQADDAICTESVQTNEPMRAAALMAGLCHLAIDSGPLSVVEVGASAGLVLVGLQQRIRLGELMTGPADGLDLSPRWTGSSPGTVPDLVGMVGLELSPIDVLRADRREWLEACVFADNPDRLGRLRDVLDVAAAHPPLVHQGDLLTDAAALIEGVPDHITPVVWHSWVLSYLTPSQRSSFSLALDEIGRRRDLAWLSFEQPGAVPDLGFTYRTRSTATALVFRRWRDGMVNDIHLADCHPHGTWINWFDPTV
jgi:hypothetical protein